MANEGTPMFFPNRFGESRGIDLDLLEKLLADAKRQGGSFSEGLKLLAQIPGVKDQMGEKAEKIQQDTYDLTVSLLEHLTVELRQSPEPIAILFALELFLTNVSASINTIDGQILWNLLMKRASDNAKSTLGIVAGMAILQQIQESGNGDKK